MLSKGVRGTICNKIIESARSLNTKDKQQHTRKAGYCSDT